MSSEDLRSSSISARPEFHRMSTSSTNLGPNVSGNKYVKIVTEVHSSRASGGTIPGSYGQNAASTIRDSREREKKDMVDLNDKLANFIEKVRFLEAQNRKLNADLDMLKSRSGTHTKKIKIIYEHELSEAKILIETTGGQSKTLEANLTKITKEVSEMKKKYEEAFSARQELRVQLDALLVTLSNLEAEIALLKRRIALLEEEVNYLKKENIRLMSDLQRTKIELDQETLNRIDYQNQLTTLAEEIDFIKKNQEEEIRDLQALASRDTTSENREYFKSELSSAIRDIRNEYDQLYANNKNDFDSWYTRKVQEIQTQSARQNIEQNHQKDECKRLKTNVTELRSKLADLEGRNALLEKQIEDLNYEIEDEQRSYEGALNDKDMQIRKERETASAYMVELQMLLDTKQTLDNEIAIYRKMLEGEGDGKGLRQLVEQVVRTTGINEVADTETMRVVKGETSARSSYSRSAKGIVSIQETAENGDFIQLENTHRGKEENIGEWKLKRKIDNKQEIVYTFPKDFVLKPFKTVKIFAKGKGPHNPPETLVFDKDDTFGVGNNVQTILYNKDGEERATHTQRSSSTN
uniref:Intermediate filament protein A n=1 Tax=Rhabditophanes sp. KR3021 TaxID=114890 RepID=A0AC35TRR5_9BILA